MVQSRRVLVITHYNPPPAPRWSAVLDNYEPGEPIGHGPTEADAVMDLYLEIEAREDEAE